jgi:hypothetical protein
MRNLTTRGTAYVVIARDKNGKQVWHSLGPIKDWQGRKRDLQDRVHEIVKSIREGWDRSGPETFSRVMEAFFLHYVEPKGLRTAKDMR